VAAQSGRFWLLPRRPPKFLSPAGAEEHTATAGTNCALTQAPSHQAEQEQAGSSSVRPPGWVSPLLASGSWLHGLWLLPRASPAAKISGTAAQSMGDGSVQGEHHPSSLQPSRLGELSRSSSYLGEREALLYALPSCSPLAGRYTPPAKLQIFWACGAYYNRTAGPRTAKGALFLKQTMA
jgi:hypothetical protein